MKWLATTILCLLATMPAIAEQDPAIFPIGMPCTPPSPTLYENFEVDNNMLPMIQGNVTFRSLMNGEDAYGRMEMLVNPETKEFVMLFFFDDDRVACILAAGEKLRPFVSGNAL